MKTYVMTTGVIFGLLVLVHVARIFADGLQVFRDSFYLISTALAAGLCFWACTLLFRSAKRP